VISALACKRKYGWKKDKDDERDLKLTLTRDIGVELPKTVNLTSKMPPVYDQGSLGSCTGQAIAAALQYNKNKQGQSIFRPSRLFIYYNERVLEGTVNQDAGAHIRDGLKVVAHLGAPPEESGRPGAWPYHVERFAVKPPVTSYNEAMKYQAIKYRRVEQTTGNILGALAEGFPIIFGFEVYTSFESQDVAKTGIVHMPTDDDNLLGGHAVLACGYDLEGYSVKDGTRILVRNSWSAGWGQKGYFTMPLEYLTNRSLSMDFWTVTQVE